jgi:hypothetical protein
MDACKLLCCFCHSVPSNVVATECCHSLFCWDCVLKASVDNHPCPTCKEPLNPENCRENLAVKKLVDKLLVPCRFDGCTANITVATKREHEKTCGYAPVLCRNSELCGIFTRNTVEKHEAENCPYRLVKCHMCMISVTLARLQDHLDKDCPEVIVPCINNCNTTGIKRSQLMGHMAEVCPNSIVTCPFAHYGCTHVLQRNEMERHLQQDVSKHLFLTTSVIENQQTQIAELQHQLTQVAPPSPQCVYNVDRLASMVHTKISHVYRSFDVSGLMPIFNNFVVVMQNLLARMRRLSLGQIVATIFLFWLFLRFSCSLKFIIAVVMAFKAYKVLLRPFLPNLDISQKIVVHAIYFFAWWLMVGVVCGCIF